MKSLIPAFLIALAGCSPRTMAVRTVSGALERGAAAFYEEPDPILAAEAMASQLKLIEALLKNDPGNRRLLHLASQGFGGYAFLFIEDAQPQRARELYLRGRDWGLRLAGRNKALGGLTALPLPELEKALGRAGPGDVPGLFWAAYGWGGWINLSKDSPEAVAGLPKVAALMRRVQELSPGYYYGGPDIFLGVYYATLPRLLGGSPEKSKAHFESALRASGGRFLLARVLYARYWAVAAQDEEAFKSLLRAVGEAAPALPEMRLADEVAKLKAKRYLEKRNDWF